MTLMKTKKEASLSALITQPQETEQSQLQTIFQNCKSLSELKYKVLN